MLRLMIIKSERFNGAIERFINLQEREKENERKVLEKIFLFAFHRESLTCCVTYDREMLMNHLRTYRCISILHLRL